MNKKRVKCDHCKQSVSKSNYYLKHRNKECLKTVQSALRNIENVANDSTIPPENQNIENVPNDLYHGTVVTPDTTINSEEEAIEAQARGTENHSSTNICNDPSFSVLSNDNDHDVSEEDEHIEESLQVQDGDEEIWDNADCDPTDDFITETQGESSEANTVLSTILKLLFIWQVTMFISDNAVNALFGVIKKTISLLNTYLQNDSLQALIDTYPSSLYTARKLAGIERDSFSKYVVCTKCDETYSYDIASTMKDGEMVSKVCWKVEFPHHNQQRFAQPCGTKLMKSVITINGKKHLYPYKVYVSQSIQGSIERMLKRKGFKKLLHKGPLGTSDYGFLSDICDGNVFKSFKDSDGSLYFQDKRNLGVMLNVDWFNPFKRSEYSLGVIYLVLLNLPRNHRFLWENVITLGIIPGPKEPSLTINSFLRPHVDELIELWDGKVFDENGSRAVYKVALLATSSDIPATRKCGGFMAHNANKGCSKCLKTFPRDQSNKPDYSGYNDEEWPLRDSELHKQYGEDWKSALNKKSRENVEFNHGARFSELFRLEYFDPIRMHLIDPMHNLMLGIAKHTFHTWIGLEILDGKSLELIEQRSSLIKVPSDVGRIPRCISKCYKSMKADEWKHWTLVYSMFSLRGILPIEYLNMWSLFVNACWLLCQRSITVEQVNESHSLLKMYCTSFERMFGKEWCVPNMHLSLHIRECILDYGSVYSFWCFSFERYNGILGRYQTNNHSITVQVMRKFISCSMLNFNEYDGSDSNCIELEKAWKMAELNSTQNFNGRNLEFLCCKNISILYKCMLPLIEIRKIQSALQELYEEPIHLVHYVKRFKRVEFLGQVFAKKNYRSRKVSTYSRILARHPGQGMAVTPGVIEDLYEVIVQREESGEAIRVTTVMVKCFFYKPVDYREFFGVNSGMELWSTEVSPPYYIPMKFIVGRYACVRQRIVVEQINNLNCSDNFNIVLRLPSKSIL